MNYLVYFFGLETKLVSASTNPNSTGKMLKLLG